MTIEELKEKIENQKIHIGILQNTIEEIEEQIEITPDFDDYIHKNKISTILTECEKELFNTLPRVYSLDYF